MGAEQLTVCLTQVLFFFKNLDKEDWSTVRVLKKKKKKKKKNWNGKSVQFSSMIMNCHTPRHWYSKTKLSLYTVARRTCETIRCISHINGDYRNNNNHCRTRRRRRIWPESWTHKVSSLLFHSEVDKSFLLVFWCFFEIVVFLTEIIISIGTICEISYIPIRYQQCTS